jgi:hypothetical protein
MTNTTNQFTSTNTSIPIGGVEELAPNVINLSERRRPHPEAPIPVNNDLVVITEPRSTIFDRSWNSAPKGTPIWAAFILGMSREEVCERFPFFTKLPNNDLTGDCKLFDEDAILVCRFDDDGCLESLVVGVPCDNFGHSQSQLVKLANFWESELFPVDRSWADTIQVIIEKGLLRITLYVIEDHFGTRVGMDMSASDPTSYEAEYRSNVIKMHPESA